MKRRGFIKGMLLAFAAPVAAKTLINKEPVLKHVEVNTDIYIEKNREIDPNWEIETEGGYFYSDELSAKLRESSQPLNQFRYYAKNIIQDDYNTLCRKRLDNIILSKN